MSGCWGDPVVQDVLGALLEALDIPHAATVGDEEVRDKILLERVMHTVVFLGGLRQDPDYVEYSMQHRLDYFRERLAACPAEGYKTWDKAAAELQARICARQRSGLSE